MVDLKTSNLSQATSVATTDLIAFSQDQGAEVYLNGSRRITFGDFSKSNVISVNTMHTIELSDKIVLANAFSSAFTVNLPAVANSEGIHVYIKKIDTSSNSVIIDPDGSETIDDEVAQYVNVKGECIEMICNGSQWHII